MTRVKIKISFGWHLVFLCLLFAACLTDRGEGVTQNLNRTGEYKLKKMLFDDDHDAEIRPVFEDETSTNVRFEIALHQILEINEKDEIVALSAFARTYWHDEYLTWDPDDYKNVSEINVSPEKLWVPDITLQNSIDREGDMRGNLDQVTKKVILNSTGYVRWFGNVILISKCPMNVRYFPFDVQECTLIFSSWVYHVGQLHLVPNRINVDLASFSTHTEWELVDAVEKKVLKKYQCCPDEYSEIHFTIRMKRRALFYVLNLILPMVLIALLTLLSFYVPSKSGERISYGVTLLLAMTLFMLLLADMIPAASDNISLMAVFFTCVIIEMVLMVFTMCYISRMYLKTAEDGRIHPWMRKFLYEYLAQKLGIRERKFSHNTGTFTKKLSYRIANGDTSVEQIQMDNEDPGEANFSYSRKRSSRGSNGEPTADEQVEDTADKKPSKFQSMGLSVIKNNQMNDERRRKSSTQSSNESNIQTKFDFADSVTEVMKRNNEALLERYQAEKEEKLWQEEWRICAMTMDYLALITFSVAFVLITLIIVAQ